MLLLEPDVPFKCSEAEEEQKEEGDHSSQEKTKHVDFALEVKIKASSLEIVILETSIERVVASHAFDVYREGLSDLFLEHLDELEVSIGETHGLENGLGV